MTVDAAGTQDVVPGAAAEDAPRRWRRLRHLRIPVLSLVGAAAAIALAGPVHARIGPFDTTLTPRPSWTGSTRLHLAPLGRIELDTHDAPVDVVLRVEQLRVAEAERIARNPSILASMELDLVADARDALRVLALRSLALAAVGGALGALAARVRWRSAVIGTAVGALLPLSVGGAAAVSFDAQAVAEPRYTGLLTIAPTAVGSVEAVVERFDDYRAQVAGLVGNVAVLYRAAQGLPTATLTDDTIKLLHVSDVHLNPQAFDLIEQVVEQFDVDAVLDTGDITDWGSEPETRLLAQVGEVGVPYVWVRGNHDSRRTQEALEQQPNAVVVDATVEEVAGVRIWGIGDPRYTPDKGEEHGQGVEKRVAESFAPKAADLLRQVSPPVDIAMVHDPRIAADFGGLAPLVLAGHTHQPRQSRLGESILLVEGSTGGAGLRGLQGDEPHKLACSVLYLDRTTHRLIAYDRVTVDGLGENGASIQRRVVPVEDEE